MNLIGGSVVQLEEGSPLTPEIRGSNAVIGSFYLLSTVLEMAHFKSWQNRKDPRYYISVYFASNDETETLADDKTW